MTLFQFEASPNYILKHSGYFCCFNSYMCFRVSSFTTVNWWRHGCVRTHWLIWEKNMINSLLRYYSYYMMNLEKFKHSVLMTEKYHRNNEVFYDTDVRNYILIHSCTRSWIWLNNSLNEMRYFLILRWWSQCFSSDFCLDWISGVIKFCKQQWNAWYQLRWLFQEQPMQTIIFD